MKSAFKNNFHAYCIFVLNALISTGRLEYRQWACAEGLLQTPRSSRWGFLAVLGKALGGLLGEHLGVGEVRLGRHQQGQIHV